MNKISTDQSSETIIDPEKLQSTQYHGIFWSFLFIANLMAVFYSFYYVVHNTISCKCLIYFLFTEYKEFYEFQSIFPQVNNLDFYYLLLAIKKCIIVALMATIVSNFGHLFIAIILPKLYLHINLFLSLALLVAPAVSLLFVDFSFLRKTHKTDEISILPIIISLVVAIIGFWQFFYRKKCLHVSKSLIVTSSSIILKHPRLIIIEFFETMVLFVSNSMLIFSIQLMSSYANQIEFSKWLYLYGLFSYYWILMTVYYACYMTTAGVAAFEYLQGNKKTLPTNVVMMSFKRALTQQFGYAVVSGLFLPIIQVFKFFLDRFKPEYRVNRKNDGIVEIIVDKIFNLIYYLFWIAFACVDKCFDEVTRYALIYCAVFGCRMRDGFKRYKQKGFHPQILRLQHSSMHAGVLYWNYFFFIVLACSLAAILHYYTFQKESMQLPITMFITIIFMTSFFSILSTLISTTTDTLFLVFLEHPDLVKEEYHELFEKLDKAKSD